MPSANFAAAIERFYTVQKTFSSAEEAYDAILDSFSPNDGTPAGEKGAAVLSSDQQKQLDAIADEFKSRKNPSLGIELGGFADATETDPIGTSDRRLHAAGDYLISKGVPRANLQRAGRGSVWSSVGALPARSE